MAFRGYAGRRVAEALESSAGALVYGGTRQFLGTRAAAEVVAKAQANGQAVTSAMIVAAEKQVLAVEDPAVVKWQLPLGGALAWLLLEGVGAYTGRQWWGEVGEGIGLPGVADMGEQGFAMLRRKQLQVTVPAGAAPGFVGGLRSPRSGQVADPPTGRRAAGGYGGYDSQFEVD